MINLVCIAKNEDKYIQEWVDHHLKLGFDKIYIFNNGSNPYKIKSSKVEQLMWNGTQIPCYNFFIQNVMNKDDWTLFIDVDEFLTLEKDKNVFEFVNCYNGADCILLNWKVYGDCGNDKYENKPVMERFKTPAPIDCIYNDTLPGFITENYHVKSFYKKTDKYAMFTNPHNVQIRNGVYVQASGKVCDCSPWLEPDWKYACVNHYLTKSMEEFKERRLNKTDACGNKIDENCLRRWYKNLNKRELT